MEKTKSFYKIDRKDGKSKEFAKFYPVEAELLTKEATIFGANDLKAIPNIGQSLIQGAAEKLSPAEYKEFAESLGLTKSMEALKEGVSSFRLKKDLAENGEFSQALKEDLTTSNSGTFTTTIQQVIMADFLRDTESILGLVYVNEDMMRTPGSGAYAIPVSQPVNATILGELGEVTYINSDITKLIASPKKIAAGQLLSWEIQKYSVPDLMKWQMRQLTDSISRYVSQYILTTLVAGTSNAVDTTGVDYDGLIAMWTTVLGATTTEGVPYNFQPDKLVLSPAGMNNFYTDTTIKNYVYFSAILSSNNNGTNLAKPVKTFLNLELVETNLLTGVKVNNKQVEAIILDSKRAGMLIKASDVEVWEGVLPRTAGDRSIIVGMLMDVVVIYGAAIGVITSA
jgi:hypothetical protein